MVTDEQLARINALAKKSREAGLSPEEQEEQKLLRRAYVDAVKNSLRSHLDHINDAKEQGL
ncbi:hypothetical protein D3C72_227700 [compost metagenome]